MTYDSGMDQTDEADRPGFFCRIGAHRWNYLEAGVASTERQCRHCDHRQQRPIGSTVWATIDDPLPMTETEIQQRWAERERRSSDAAFFLVDDEGATIDRGDAAHIRAEIRHLSVGDQEKLQVLAYADGQRSGAPISAVVFLAATQA